MRERIVSIAAMVLVLAFLSAGCSNGLKVPSIKREDDQAQLIKVEITFESGKTLDGYIKGLKLGKDTTVYAGGMASTSLYDAKGNVTGAFNYGRVLYIKVLE